MPKKGKIQYHVRKITYHPYSDKYKTTHKYTWKTVV